MRKWYGDGTVDLSGLCASRQIKCVCGIRQNSDDLAAAIREVDAGLGLSLGNGYISSKTFTIPRFGMINVHSEILPQYQNAQSIIWPIYCNDPFTGFTIHEINKKIDGGRILCQKRVPIQFRRKLGDTVVASRELVDTLIPGALADVCANFDEYRRRAKVQTGGKSYTTPSIWQFLRMCSNNKRFFREKN